MKIKLIKTPLRDLLIIEIKYFIDKRGFFIEPWHKRDFLEGGIDAEFVQEGHSRSRRGVLRGLHYQNMTAPMGKLVRCTLGRVFEVAVDLRTRSKTFGKWYGLELSAKNMKLFYVPVGFGLGFVTLTPYAEVQYKQTGYYTPSSEGTILWNDPDVGIAWPVKNPILSQRDLHGVSFRKYKNNPVFDSE